MTLAWCPKVTLNGCSQDVRLTDRESNESITKRNVSAISHTKHLGKTLHYIMLYAIIL